ncbi:carbamoyltransferase [Daejeonella rubra]|uniref:Carbamoyltransferase n=1 Tax=Daejeonella rubra TaxID=990371 RepID=A0A1G9WVJ9_9SPHI|nr:carbamoyltransferase C-terminal domain-containing protein [Daejeonella rubra]SDM88528.1 carbamoyltransferase [Daejeonella rubra]
MKKNHILSFTLSGHGFSGAVCTDGIITYATSLERITRIKNDILFPISKADLETFGWKADPKTYMEQLDFEFDMQKDYSTVDIAKVEKFQLLLNYLLDVAEITLEDVDCVVYSYRHNEIVRKFFKEKNPNIKFIVPEHHFSHACQAFLPSPFDDAAIMVVDGQGVPMVRTGGDQLSGSLSYGKGIEIETLWEFPVRYSLGGMYAEFTKKLGFKTNQEGKTMGLAAYGTSAIYDEIKKELKFEELDFDFRKVFKKGLGFHNALYKLPDYGNYLKQFENKKKEEEYTQTHKDLAYAVQKLTEDVMVYLANWLYEKTGSKNLCISGGVGLNCVANYQVLSRSKFDNIFIHPNAGDNGLVVGQALYVYNILNKNPRVYVDTHDYLGKQYSETEVDAAIDKFKDNDSISIQKCESLPVLYDTMAKAIADGYITSWCQGGSEFGPRALGNRSILADPRRADMKDILNSRVKFRESFRPFTPSVLAERSSEFFELDIESPFMLLAPYVKPGKGELVPAITHADNTARVQTVTRDVNERYYDLIKAFEKLTGIPMVLDTSYNVADEPIVETPEDAIRCFLSTDIDILGIDRYILRKKAKFNV